MGQRVYTFSFEISKMISVPNKLKMIKIVAMINGTAKILDFFLAAENNNDLLNTYTKDCLSASCTHALLTKLKNKKEFKDEWLKPLGVTFGDII